MVLISNLCTLGRSNFHSRATVLVSDEIWHIWELYFLSLFKHLWKSDFS